MGEIERAEAEVKRRKLNSGEGSSNSSGGGGDICVSQQTWSFYEEGQGFNCEEFNGVGAEDKLTAFEIWQTSCT